MAQELIQYKVPTLADLISDKEMAYAQDDFNLILNTPVPKQWIKEHPYVTIKIDGKNAQLPYVPVKRVKYLLKRIYGKYEWEIKECKQVLNAMVVVGKLTITNPITGLKESQDGVGAAAIQMDKDATQGDLTAIKANAIQIGAPAAESYALKNAAEKFGDIFGGNIYDIDKTAYTPVFDYDSRNPPTYEQLKDLADDMSIWMILTKDEQTNASRILTNKEVNSYVKLYKLLTSKQTKHEQDSKD